MNASKSGLQVLRKNEGVLSLFRQATRSFGDDLLAAIKINFTVDAAFFSFNISDTNGATKKDPYQSTHLLMYDMTDIGRAKCSHVSRLREVSAVLRREKLTNGPIQQPTDRFH
jgi:hypothetical protein